ncbi:TorD/DmsD family molecular chaperone [Noviherbaspirillum soli]|uniref:TorD/DmsD family molecular chaperone n=1 Tax=Noviherbaspirillum soli TaxID=1064518 RepID=UPI001889E255|nr:molecular chaperone TorD family protein [Noviherbaspirillum soli]
MHADEDKFALPPDGETATAPVGNAQGGSIIQSAEEQGRARFYTLLAMLLFVPPSSELLHALANADPIAGETGRLESAWEQLVLVAGIMDAEAVREEFDALFVSTGTPLINPHASLYLSGFMMDRPLAALRDTLRGLGVVRRAGASQLEDHLGSLFETMALLIAQGRPLTIQREVFDAYIGSWIERCLTDIREMPSANFYRKIADVIEAFYRIEVEAFELAPHARS